MDRMLELIEKGQYWLVVPAIILAVLFNLDKIAHYFESRKKSKSTLMQECIKNVSSGSSTESFMKELLEMEAFRVATGVYAHKEKRDALIKLYERNKSKTSIYQIKNAAPMIDEVGGNLVVNIGWFNYASYIFSWVASLIMLLFGIVLLMFMPKSGIESVQQLISLLTMGLFFLFVGFYMFLETVPVYSARKISKLINS